MTTETVTHALTPRRVLWLALCTVLAASAVHVAGTFSTLEPGGALPVLARMGPYTGVLAAIAVDLGLLGLSWGVGARKRDKPGETPYDLWGGIAIFAVLSALANFDHALSVLGSASGTSGAAAWVGLDRYTRVKVVALSATLPLLAIYLTRVVETAVDAGRDRESDTAQQDAIAEDRRAERAARQAEWQAEHERSQAEMEKLIASLSTPAAPDWPLAHEIPASANGHATSCAGELEPVGIVTLVPPGPRKASPIEQGKLTPARYRALAAAHVPAGTGAQEADRIVAARAGVSAKTAQRARLAGQE